MNDNTFHITFGSLDDLANRARNAMREGKEQKTQSALFQNINEFMNFMFPGKFLILMTIRSKSPSSLYELAQLVQRSQPGVLRDCRELELMNFITLKKSGSRNALVPQLSFDYDNILVSSNFGETCHILPKVA